MIITNGNLDSLELIFVVYIYVSVKKKYSPCIYVKETLSSLEKYTPLETKKSRIFVQILE